LDYPSQIRRPIWLIRLPYQRPRSFLQVPPFPILPPPRDVSCLPPDKFHPPSSASTHTYPGFPPFWTFQTPWHWTPLISDRPLVQFFSVSPLPQIRTCALSFLFSIFVPLRLSSPLKVLPTVNLTPGKDPTTRSDGKEQADSIPSPHPSLIISGIPRSCMSPHPMIFTGLSEKVSFPFKLQLCHLFIRLFSSPLPNSTKCSYSMTFFYPLARPNCFQRPSWLPCAKPFSLFLLFRNFFTLQSYDPFPSQYLGSVYSTGSGTIVPILFSQTQSDYSPPPQHFEYILRILIPIPTTTLEFLFEFFPPLLVQAAPHPAIFFFLICTLRSRLSKHGCPTFPVSYFLDWFFPLTHSSHNFPW